MAANADRGADGGDEKEDEPSGLSTGSGRLEVFTAYHVFHNAVADSLS